MATHTTCDRCEKRVSDRCAPKLTFGAFIPTYSVSGSTVTTGGAWVSTSCPSAYAPHGKSRTLDLCPDCARHVMEVALPALLERLTEKGG